jgi:hypothetical protein
MYCRMFDQKLTLFHGHLYNRSFIQYYNIVESSYVNESRNRNCVMIALKNDRLKIIDSRGDQVPPVSNDCYNDTDDQRLTFLLEYFLFLSYFIYPYFIIMSKNYVSL